MNTAQLRELIFIRYGEITEVSHFEAKPWLNDEKRNQSWRDYLIFTMRRRLVGAAERGVSKQVIEETESFVRHLECFDQPQILYSFSASSDKIVYAGWIIEDDIVFCLPNNK